MAATTPATAPARGAIVNARRLASMARSEFTKMRSVRSTYLTLLVLILVTVGFGCLLCWAVEAQWTKMPASSRAAFDPASASLSGFFLGQLVISVLGALTITSEYSTGLIRTTLTTQPHRGSVYAAKALVVASASFVTGLVAGFISFFLGQAILAGRHANVTLGDPSVLRAVIGSGLFLAACGLFAYGIAAIVRHTAGAISTALGLLFLPTILVKLLPSNWQQDVTRWLPAEAGSQLLSALSTAREFTAWTGFGLFCAYTAVLLAIGLVAFDRRDL